MSVYITGDIHGSIDIRKLNSDNFPEQKNMTKDDILIILGDFGLIWDVGQSGKEEQYWLDWLNSRNFTVFCILGNHENYDRLNQCPKVGKNLRKIHDSIFWMENGIHIIQGKVFFTFGGGTSIDKMFRKENVSWWPEEIPNCNEFERCLEIIETVGQVDCVLTHAAPESLLNKIFINENFKKEASCQVEKYLDIVREKLIFDDWFFGHYHKDKIIDLQTECVYYQIIKII
ncbi:MAG: metallophosphatase [Lutibacter sp.]|uniref:metallophosphoesterase family protein n=1 Tax=Lutibacter sp. TaxID=1925666 RepID=UPI0019FA37D3|nr:metallophosphoesterase [Lutibacter sp.]NOR27541.1 metallophosphatase [Lutibacter sp.]